MKTSIIKAIELIRKELGVATVLDLYASWKAGCFSGLGDILLLAGAALAFAALIYCLFFALPFEQTYADQDSGSRVCRSGVYALCRHPGVLCFAVMYLLLGLAALLLAAVIPTVASFLYYKKRS